MQVMACRMTKNQGGGGRVRFVTTSKINRTDLRCTFLRSTTVFLFFSPTSVTIKISGYSQKRNQVFSQAEMEVRARWTSINWPLIKSLANIPFIQKVKAFTVSGLESKRLIMGPVLCWT